MDAPGRRLAFHARHARQLSARLYLAMCQTQSHPCNARKAHWETDGMLLSCAGLRHVRRHMFDAIGM
jgi:hypothetical protein